ncbi:MAG: hypothetical protein D6719_03860 [Candidatus Dadabacteria bacterium]|nr:MAG: hypothetical protein D6719_03860 [Candidatus Dadabacteria bacterium]
MQNSGGNKSRKGLNETHLNQIAVLRSLSRSWRGADEPTPIDITEIAQESGVNDEKEIQRYLFILEGQKLVAPQPAGDFTSKTWHITRTGMKALKTIARSTNTVQ